MELQIGLALPTQHRCQNNKHIIKNKRSFQELSFGHFMKPSLPLFVWSGQPNEEDERSKKMQRNSHTSNKNNEENHMVGWPPIKSWRKKELHQQQHPAAGGGGHIGNHRMQQGNENRGYKE